MSSAVIFALPKVSQSASTVASVRALGPAGMQERLTTKPASVSWRVISAATSSGAPSSQTKAQRREPADDETRMTLLITWMAPAPTRMSHEEPGSATHWRLT